MLYPSVPAHEVERRRCRSADYGSRTGDGTRDAADSDVSLSDGWIGRFIAP